MRLHELLCYCSDTTILHHNIAEPCAALDSGIVHLCDICQALSAYSIPSHCSLHFFPWMHRLLYHCKIILISNSAWTFGTSLVAIHLANAFGPTEADNWDSLTVLITQRQNVPHFLRMYTYRSSLAKSSMAL